MLGAKDARRDSRDSRDELRHGELVAAETDGDLLWRRDQVLDEAGEWRHARGRVGGRRHGWQRGHLRDLRRVSLVPCCWLPARRTER